MITTYCADAQKLPLKDTSVDLIITNPPHFTVDGTYYGGDQMKQISHGSATKKNEYWALLTTSTREMARVLRNDGSLVMAVGQGEYPRFNTFEYEHVLFCTQELGLTLTSEINWHISNNIYSRDHLHHEHKIFRHYTKNSDYYRNQFEIANLNPASWDISYTENNPDLLKVGNLGHGFPLELVSRLIRCFSKQDSVIFDPYAGTGTVNVAAGLFNRSSIYLDCSDEQVQVAQKRFDLFKLPHTHR